MSVELANAKMEADRTGQLVIVDHGDGLLTAVLPKKRPNLYSRNEPERSKRGAYVVSVLEKIKREVRDMEMKLETSQQPLKYKAQSTILHIEFLIRNIERGNVAFKRKRPNDTKEAE
jgi:hypothetical protein